MVAVSQLSGVACVWLKEVAPRAIALLVVVCCFTSWPASAATKWEISPYRVQAGIVAADATGWTATDLARLEQQVAVLVNAHLGAAWSFASFRPSVALRGEMLTCFDQLAAARAMQLASPLDGCDKLFLAVIGGSAARPTITIRELDITTQQLSPLQIFDAANRENIAETVVQSMVAIFAPLVELERAEGNEIAGKLRAASLVDEDNSPILVGVGAPLVPIIRVDDRLGRATSDQVSVIPLTVLAVTSRKGAIVECEIHSATRHRLGARASLRLARYGLAVKAPLRNTRLLLQATAGAAPLVNYELVERDAASGDIAIVGRTDPRGAINIVADGRPWRLLYVRQGENLLARVPLVTGLQNELALSIPNNDVRLRAEGFVAALRQEVVDTVARRQILTARLRQQMSAGNLDAAQQTLDTLQRLAGSREFEMRMNEARTKFVGDNARTQQHIEELFRETRESLARYLDPQEIKRLETQLAQARRPR